MESGGRVLRGLVSMLALGLCGLAMAAEPVYRWTDSRGQVNYGNLPPSGVKAERLGDSGALSVMPALPAARRPAVSAVAEPVPPRAAPASSPPPALEPAAADEHKRIECEERLREPCDDSGRALRPAVVVLPQRPAHPPAHPPAHLPAVSASPRPLPPRSTGMPKPVLPLDLSDRDERPAPPPRHEPERRGRAFPPP
jgi:hypothetical protein